jgi:hypothetical protein
MPAIAPFFPFAAENIIPPSDVLRPVPISLPFFFEIGQPFLYLIPCKHLMAFGALI